MKIHHLKAWPPIYQAMLDGRKPFDFRKNDRGFAAGDIVVFWEWDPEALREPYTGRFFDATITYLIHGGQFGIPKGFVVFAFEKGVDEIRLYEHEMLHAE